MNKQHNQQRLPVIARLLRWAIYAMAFMPLIIFSQFLSPFHFGKIVVFRSGVEAMAVLYVVLLLLDYRYLPKRTMILWISTLFTALYGLTTFLGVDVSVSFWGTLERMGGFYSFLHFWIFFLIMLSVLRTKQDWIDLLRVSLFVGLLSTFYGFLQKTDAQWVIGSGGRNKIFGTIGNAALFAGYELLNIFWALILLFRRQTTVAGRYFYGSVFLLDSLAVILSGIRGSVLGLFVGVLLFLVAYGFIFKIRWVKRSAFLVLIVSAIVLGLLVTFRNTEFVKSNSYLSRYSDFSVNSYTVQTRSWTWRSGLEGWKDSFKSVAVGYGPENFDIPFSRHFNPKHFVTPNSETLFDRAHNMFIEVLVTMGVIGELGYLLLLFYPLYAMMNVIHKIRQTKNRTPEDQDRLLWCIGLTTALVVYMIHNFFIFDTAANYLVFFTTYGMIYIILYGDQTLASPQPRTNKSLAYSAGIVAAVVAGWLIYSFNIVPVYANYATTRAIVAGWENKQDVALAKYKEALGYNLSIHYEIVNRYAQYIIEKSGGTQTPELREALQDAITREKDLALHHPDDYVPLLYVSRLNILLGKDDPKSAHNDEALEYSMKALRISPTFVRTYFEIAQAYLNKKDYVNGVKYFRQAVALNPNAPVSNWYLGSSLLESGNVSEGSQYLKIALRQNYIASENEYLRLVNILNKEGDNADVVLAYEKLVDIKPDNAQYHASLAAAYAKIGKLGLAVEQARAAVRIDPAFEKDASTFVRSIGRSL